jgi:hypothetical protein
MLSVLLDGAGERTRPSRKETTDLLRGALKLHLRRMVGADGGIDHRDVLAIVSLLGPVILLAGAAQTVDWLAGALRSGSPLSWEWALSNAPNAPVWGIWFVVAVLSLARMRLTAAVGAWLGTAAFLVIPLHDYATLWDSVVTDTGWMLLGLVVAAALTWSPGPARGWALVGGARFALLAGAVATSVVLVMTSYGTFDVLHVPVVRMMTGAASHLVVWGLALVLLAAGAVGAGGGQTRVGRRAALVLCVPVLVSVLMLVLPKDAHLLIVAAVCYAVPVAVLLGLGGLPRRTSWPPASVRRLVSGPADE